MATPSVAIIIPTLDNEQTIDACLRAVANLDWPRADTDLIVVDGGSRDSTLAQVRAHPARVFVRQGSSAWFRRSFGAGQTDAMRVFFLDPDCLPPRDWIRAASHHLQFAHIAAVGVRPLPPHGAGASWVQRSWAARGLARPPAAEAARLDPALLALRRADFLRAGGFRDEDGSLAADALLSRAAGDGGTARPLLALTRPDGVRLTASRTLAGFYRAQRRLGCGSLIDELRPGWRRARALRALLPLYGVAAVFFFLLVLLRLCLPSPPGAAVLAIAAASALAPSLLPALRDGLRSRRPGVILPLGLLYLVRLTARGAAAR